MKDALGNEVIIGNKYGYSTNDTVFVGRAMKFTTSRVTLETIFRKHYLYGKEIDRTYGRIADTVSVSSYLLFPVVEDV